MNNDENFIDENFGLSGPQENNNFEFENDTEDDMNGDYLFNFENTTNTKYKIQAKLKPYTYYKFQVYAVNLIGESRQSESIRVRTAAASKFKVSRNITQNLIYFSIEPGFVRNIRYTHQGNSVFTIKCDEPIDPNGNLIVITCYKTS